MALYLNGSKISNSMVVNGRVGITSDPVNISDFSFSNKINTTTPTVTKISDYEFALSFQDQSDSGYEQCLFKVTLSAGTYVAQIKATVDKNTGISSSYTWGIYSAATSTNITSDAKRAYSTYVPFDRSDTNEHTYYVPIVVQTDGYAYICFTMADDSGANATVTVSSLMIYPAISVIEDGTFTPIFSETVLVDNSSLASSFTFSEDYNNYQFLKFRMYNSSWQNYFSIITTPESINAIMDITSYIDFNDFGNNQYACYSYSADKLTWTRNWQRNLNIFEVAGLNCTNATVTKTQIYKATSTSGSSVSITSQDNLLEFDWIIFTANDSDTDEVQPCYNVFCKNDYDNSSINAVKGETEYYFPFNGYNYAGIIKISEYSIWSNSYAYIQGIKFTPT